MILSLVIMQQLVALKIKEGTNNGSHHVQLKAPNSLSGNVEFTLPSADGSADQFLKTNGSGTLSFGTISSSFHNWKSIVVLTIHLIPVRHLHLLVEQVLTQLYQTMTITIDIDSNASTSNRYHRHSQVMTKQSNHHSY